MGLRDGVPQNHTFSLIFTSFLNLAVHAVSSYPNTLKLGKLTNFNVIFLVIGLFLNHINISTFVPSPFRNFEMANRTIPCAMKDNKLEYLCSAPSKR
jgi:hypothetical protein